MYLHKKIPYIPIVLIWHGFCTALYIRGPLEACAISNRTRGTPRSRRDKPLSVSRCFRKVIPGTSFGRNRNLARSQLGASSSYQIRIRPLLHQNLKCMLLAFATSVPKYDPQITTCTKLRPRAKLGLFGDNCTSTQPYEYGMM